MRAPPFPHRCIARSQHVRHDPLLGHAFVAGTIARVPHEHGAYFAVTNAQGFRDDHDLETPPAGFHALCFGDSYAAGDGVDNHERFSALLARRLGITVSNLALPGYGPDQNLLQLERTKLPRADLILWCIAVQTIERIQSGKRIAIDREDRLWSVDRPHFRLGADGALELRGVPVPEKGEPLIEEPPPQVRDPLVARCAAALARLRERASKLLGPYLKPPPDPDYADRGSSGWRLLTAIVKRFHASAGGVPVAIVPLPCSRYLTEGCTPHFQPAFRELQEPQRGLHALDVVTGLGRFPAERRAAFHYRLDGHLTAAGHAAVAETLAEELRARDLVQSQGEPGSAASGIPAARDGSRADQPSLQVCWHPDDGTARLYDRGTLVAEHRETAVTGVPCRPGVLPLSAVHACLEDARVAGPDLGEVVLVSPCAIADLDGCAPGDQRALDLASGFVRWLGAAEIDLRRFLCFQGPVREELASARGLWSAAPPPQTTTATDDELDWLGRRIRRLLRARGRDTLERALRRLGRLWELSTRAARESAMPTTAPLRRGRMARRLARRIEA
jgi:hypothetical protein